MKMLIKLGYDVVIVTETDSVLMHVLAEAKFLRAEGWQDTTSYSAIKAPILLELVDDFVYDERIRAGIVRIKEEEEKEEADKLSADLDETVKTIDELMTPTQVKQTDEDDMPF